MHILDEAHRLDLPGAAVYWHPHWLPSQAADALLAELLTQTAWEQPVYHYMGQAVPMPRQVAWFSDAPRPYGYSGVTHQPVPLTPALQQLRARLTQETGAPFDSVLLNRYRDGRDSVAWHADNERELGPTPVIASISLGAPRRFSFKPVGGKALTHLELTHGSLLVMAGRTQQAYVHQVPKTTKPVGERVNLTFRHIVG